MIKLANKLDTINYGKESKFDLIFTLIKINLYKHKLI